MPDRWGRVTGEDFMTAAKGLGALRKEKAAEQDVSEVNHALGIMNESGDFELFDGIGISPLNKAKADEIYAKTRVAKQQGDDADMVRQQTQLENEYLGLASKAQSPEERLKTLGQINPDTLAGARALASVQKQLLGSQDNQVALLGSALKKGEAEYSGVLRPAIVSAQDLFAKGKTEDAANALAAVSKVLPVRGEWRVEADDQGAVRLRRYHNERDAGLGGASAQGAPSSPVDQSRGLGLGEAPQEGTEGSTAGGVQGLGLDAATAQPARSAAPADHYSPTDDVVTVDKAIEALSNMSSKDYALQMAAHRAANMDFNAKALESGGHMGVDRKGQKVRVVPLISPDDSTRQFAVYDAKTGSIIPPDPEVPQRTMFTSDDFFKSGIQIVNKEQRALDNDERRVRNDERRTSVEERRLGLQEQSLGLRGSKAKTPFDEGYAEYQKGVAASEQHDPLGINGTPEEAGKKRLAEFTKGKYGRVMSLDELRETGGRGGGAGQGAQQSAQPQRPANDAQSLWDSYQGK